MSTTTPASIATSTSDSKPADEEGTTSIDTKPVGSILKTRKRKARTTGTTDVTTKDVTISKKEETSTKSKTSRTRKKKLSNENESIGQVVVEQHPVVKSLLIIDPILQFLTKATGETSIGLSTVYRTIPSSVILSVSSLSLSWSKQSSSNVSCENLLPTPELLESTNSTIQLTENDCTCCNEINSTVCSNDTKEVDNKPLQTPTESCENSVLAQQQLLFLHNINTLVANGLLSYDFRCNNNSNNKNDDDVDDNNDNENEFYDATNTKYPQEWDDARFFLGFPPPASEQQNQEQNTIHNTTIDSLGTIHGSTKLAGKRRLSALHRIIKANCLIEIPATDFTNNSKGTVVSATDCCSIEHDNDIGQSASFRSTSITDGKTESLNDIRTETIVASAFPSDVGCPDEEMKNTMTKSNDTIFETPPRNRKKRNRFAITDDEYKADCDNMKTNEEEYDDCIDSNTNGSQSNLVPLSEVPTEAFGALRKIFQFHSFSESTVNEDMKKKQRFKGSESKIAKQQLERNVYCDNNNNNKNITTNIRKNCNAIPDRILARQASYAGSYPSQEARYASLPDSVIRQIPTVLLHSFGLHAPSSDKQTSNTATNSATTHNSETKNLLLFQHQVDAISAALTNRHVSVCTGTGSGKSLCFLIPALTSAYNDNAISLILYPTKALAQDQLSKLQSILATNKQLQERIIPATIDGDTAHTARMNAADYANIILTNPDTLHASMLPNWKTKHYTHLISRVKYVIVDEAHLYEGIFGAHVALILRRLVRCIILSSATSCSSSSGAIETAVSKSICTVRLPVFLSMSATLPHPESHFRQLFPIAPSTAVLVLSSVNDGSPRSAKHYFVWNPPILNNDGTSTCKVEFTEPSTSAFSNGSESIHNSKKQRHPATVTTINEVRQSMEDINVPVTLFTGEEDEYDDRLSNNLNVSSCREEFSTSTSKKKQFMKTNQLTTKLYQRRSFSKYHRRHAAEEMALLVARAVSQGVRCIAFCKTRNVVEWVYSRTIDALRIVDPSLIPKVESYRGGYSMIERRKIESRLFNNKLLAVVGTNALELGVDIGGIDVTFHCGYPSSYASLIQQAGRAGRGKTGHDVTRRPSLSIMICFNSPSEQQMWRRPSSLLGQGAGMSSSCLIPFTTSIVQSHVACASDEFPLSGNTSLVSIVTGANQVQYMIPLNEDATSATIHSVCDAALFGQENYDNSIRNLIANNSVVPEVLSIYDAQQGTHGDSTVQVTLYRAHTGYKKVSASISIRSIEPINYSLVNLAHPGQAGRMDGLHDDNALMDTIPYSRIFYQAHPGAIIQHRGRKFKIISMTRPPAYIADTFNCRRSFTLAAFAKPTTAKYVTRPISLLHITVVNQIESIELSTSLKVRTLNEETRDKEINDETICLLSQEVDSMQGGCNNNPADIPAENNTYGNDISPDIVGVHTLLGCGTVSVKRTVSGYKKLSLINFAEISREELMLPPMEYETFGVYIVLDLVTLKPILGRDFGPGVHALSHALLAVAPLFAPGLVRGDVESDHSAWDPSHIMLFDQRAGGSGSVARLWNSFVDPKNNILEAALELLESCSFCRTENEYDNGCPSCLHAPNCLRFNLELSRSAAVVVGTHMLKLIKRTNIYQSKLLDQEPVDAKDFTPRRRARQRALSMAKDLASGGQRQFVVGRPSWPTDN